MPTIISNNAYDFTNSHVVSVIASFDTHGHIRPLYVRIGEDSLKIISCWMKPAFLHTCIYNCQVNDNGTIKPLVLTYYMRESVWTIPKY